MKGKSFFSIVFIILGLAAALGISFLSFKETKRNRQIEQEIATMKKEAEGLKNDNQDMQEKIAYFDTPEFEEKIAKEKLNFQKEGENVAVIKPSPVIKSESNTAVAGEEESKTPEKPNYVKWWEQFFRY